MRTLPVLLLLGSGLYAQAPVVTGVYNAASLDNRLSPGCVAIVHGSNLGVGDAVVTIGGLPAPVIIGTPTDMNRFLSSWRPVPLLRMSLWKGRARRSLT